MKQILRKITLIAVIALFSGNLFAQGIVTGKVTDALTDEGLIQATILVEGTSNGTTTDMNGNFSLSVPTGKHTIVINYIGYMNYTKSVEIANGATVELGVIPLESSQIGLNEINVLANIAIDRKTPVAVSTIKSAEIEEVLGSQELPEVLNRTPSVYATKGSGGYGDSKITIRGFSQENVAVLINGIPVNDMENGKVYWSNWSGIGDAVSSMQVQRGLGASKLAINSVGGTMNILTKTTEAEKGGSIVGSFTDYGQKKTMVTLNSGLAKDGLAVTFVGSRTTGPGYVDANYVDAWSYYLSLSRDFGTKHKLLLTVIGAPQKHGQRDFSQYSAQTYDHMEKFGTRYNPNWGYIGGGTVLNERNNFYHKPQIAANWYFQIDENNFLATSAYVSTGNGGGSGVLGKGSFTYGAPQNALGQRDWDVAVDANARPDDIHDSLYDGSQLIMRNSMNNHLWMGVLSSINSELTEHLDLTAGIDIRHYKGEHYREVRDLLGGEYWDDAVNNRAQVGDRIAYDNDGLVTYEGVFAQLELDYGNLSAFVAATVSNTTYGRTDRYNFARGRMDSPDAEKVNQLGYNGKLGLNYNVSEASNFFFNLGYYSRAPFHSFVYINYGNDINPNLANEKIAAAEIGYGLNLRKITLRVNAYYTNWDDKWAKGYVRFTDDAGVEHNGSVYYQGLNENHTGAEIEIKWKAAKILEIGAFGSIGDWRYTSDTKVDIYDDDTRELIGQSTVYVKDLKVADAPQTQVGLTGRLSLGNYTFGADYVYNDQLYSYFDPTDRIADKDGIIDRAQSYQMESYGVFNGMAQYNFTIAGLKSTFRVNAYNIMNKKYAMLGWDNATRDSNGEYGHSKDNFMGFWGFERTFNFSLKVIF